jgi:hypothetical protein
MDQAPQGLCYRESTHEYVLFRGERYAANDPENEAVPSSRGVAVSSTPSRFDCQTGGVAFAQLSATTSEVRITLIEHDRVSKISLNDEGRLDW